MLQQTFSPQYGSAGAFCIRALWRLALERFALLRWGVLVFCVRALWRFAFLRLLERSNLHKLPQVERSDTVAAVQDCERIVTP